MLNAIIQFSIRNKLIIGLMVLALVGTGIYQVTRLPVDALPDITSNQVQVITVSPALAAPEVERLVTFTVEQFCSNIQGIQEMRSISRFGLSVVTIVFDDNTDIYWARQQVAERLTYIKDEIPTGAGTPVLAPLTTGLGEVFQYVVKPAPGYEAKYSLEALRSIQDWIIRKQLLGTPGVADVSSFGGNLKQYEVSFRAERLKAMGLTVSDVYNALQANNQNSGGAYIEKSDQLLFIRTEGLIRNMEDIRNIVLKESGTGTPILLSDVANVQIGKAIRYGALVDGDAGEVSGAVVLMLKGANGMEVVNQLKQRMAAIQKTLPEGVVVETFYDRSKMVKRAINTVQKNLLEGALIVVLVLVLFLGNLRAGLMVASVIPLSMLFAIIMMNLFGVTGNLMSLGALDFGLIVDGAVIIVEAVLHRLHHQHRNPGLVRISGQTMDTAVEHAAGKMMNAAVFGQVIILIVYLPILALVGIEGKMFRPMAQTVSFALVGAFLLSLTYVPMITSIGLSKKISGAAGFSDRFMAALERAYAPVVTLALKNRKSLLLGVGIVFLFSLGVLMRLGGEFIPELEEGDFAVDTRLLTGSSLTASVEKSMQAAELLKRQFPEVEKIVCRIGASEIPTDPMPVEMGDLIISLKDKSTWTSAASYDELADTMSRVLDIIPGLSAGFQFPVQMRFNELISGARQDVVCKIFGDNLDTLAAYAEKIGALSRQVEGADDLYVEAVTGLPQIVVSYRREAMALYGVTIDAVNQVVRTAFAGERAGLVFENERRFELVLRLDAAGRTGLEDVRQLLVPASGGMEVPLYMLADIEIKEGPNQIQRENANRRIIVAFNVRNRDVESVVDELQKSVDKKIKLPEGYYIKYGGAFENLTAAKNRLMIAVPVSLCLIFLLLYFAFQSVKYSLLIFSAIPLSAIGGIFALWIRDMPFSISAGVGFIALFGVAVLNGIVLITEFNRLKKEGRLSMHDIILQGTRTRLRPVLMTAAVASFGFLPMALSQSAGAEVQRPLASVVIGGLISATFLTLVVLPILYSWVEKLKPGRGKSKLQAMIFSAVLLGGPVVTNAQSPIGLEDALGRIAAQNGDLKVGMLQKKYLEALQATAGAMPRARAMAEIGQTNSVNTDSRLSLLQGFLPFGYVEQEKKWLGSALVLQDKEMLLKKADLRLMVRLIYYEHGYQGALLQHYRVMDSLYGKAILMAEQRLRTGESGRLELAGLRQQQLMLQPKTEAAVQQQSALAIQLQTLLSLPEKPQMKSAWEPLPMPLPLADTSGVARHPLVQVKEAQQLTAQMETGLEKARLKPELELGYNNQSLIGFQTLRNGTERFYEAGNRFSTAQVGVSFPLISKAQRAKVKAAQQKEKVLEEEVALQRYKLSGEWKWRLEQQWTMWNQVRHCREKIQPGSNDILQLAAQQLRAGELNYLNWMLLVAPAFETNLDCSEKVRNYLAASAFMAYLME